MTLTSTRRLDLGEGPDPPRHGQLGRHAQLGAHVRASPNFMGLASLGLEIGIFCDFYIAFSY
jgi:hypothetical protein